MMVVEHINQLLNLTVTFYHIKSEPFILLLATFAWFMMVKNDFNNGKCNVLQFSFILSFPARFLSLSRYFSFSHIFPNLETLNCPSLDPCYNLTNWFLDTQHAKWSTIPTGEATPTTKHLCNSGVRTFWRVMTAVKTCKCFCSLGNWGGDESVTVVFPDAADTATQLGARTLQDCRQMRGCQDDFNINQSTNRPLLKTPANIK